MCQVETKQVIGVHDVSTTYHVPLLLEKQGMAETVATLLQLDSVPKTPALVTKGQGMWQQWIGLATGQDFISDKVTIALVGKYMTQSDAYISVHKSLEHAALHCRKKLNLIWVEASSLEDAAQQENPAEFHRAWHAVCTADGILVPGGFGVRGTEGMIKAINWARTKNVPFLGVCLGMQLAVVEYARNVCKISGAGSEELQPESENHVIVYMPEVRPPIFLTRSLMPPQQRV